jgi:hypothetical protein
VRGWTVRAGLEALLALGVVLAALQVLADSARETELHNDESRYIARARFYYYLFVERDVGRSKWGDSIATHTQPMLANYVVGGWLYHVHDYDVRELDVARTETTRTRSGRLIEREIVRATLLARAREPFVALGAGTVLLLYLLARRLANPLAGLVTAGLALGSPLSREYLVLVRSEAPLMFFTFLGLLLAMVGVARGRAMGLPAGWALASGLATGLALATKLTAALSLAVMAAWAGLAVLVALAAAPRGAGLAGRLGRAWRAGRGWGLALVVATTVFVASNPHLYPEPIRHTRHLVLFRGEELERQREAYASIAVDGVLERAALVARESLLDSTATGALGIPFEPLTALLGLGLLAAGAWRGWRRDRHPGPWGLLLLTTLAYYLGTAAVVHIDWPRYYLPTLLFGTILSGFAVASGVVWPARAPWRAGRSGLLSIAGRR